MNRKIDHSNYEAWLLDRLEGSLTPEQERQLNDFLAANPGLDSDDGALPSLHELEAGLTQAEKDALKRSLPPAGMPCEPIGDFLIARSEGDLDPQQEEALRQYLLDHPEHQRAERLYAHAKLVPEVYPYAGKKALHRHLPPTGMPTHPDLDDLLVARLEGDLSAEQEQALAALIDTDRSARRTWLLLQHTRTLPQPVVYADKAGLKKGGRVVPISAGGSAWKTALRAAAVIAVLLTSGIWLLDRGPGRGVELAGLPDAGQVLPAEGAQSTGAAAKEQPSTGTIRSASPDGLATEAIVPRERVVGQEEASGVPVPSQPLERTAQVQYAQGRPVTIHTEAPRGAPLHVSVPEFELLAFAGFEEEQGTATGSEGVRLGDLLAGKLRKRMLDAPAEDYRPLDTDDAFAVLDKGLRKVAGGNAGLEVEYAPAGGLHRFDLRLGRNLAITANR